MLGARQDNAAPHTTALSARVIAKAGTRAAVFPIEKLIVAGWTARDAAAMEHHIAELEALGVRRPAQTPTFYRVAHRRLTQTPSIEVTGEETSGELEFVLVEADGEHYVGIGSDHTDRRLETVGVTVSKQVCDKPVGVEFWPLSEVAGHWDDLELRAYATIDGVRELYQDGKLGAMLAPTDLMQRYDGAASLPARNAMFGGTVPAIGGVRPATRFEGEIVDPVLNRKLTLAYDVRLLPVHG